MSPCPCSEHGMCPLDRVRVLEARVAALEQQRDSRPAPVPEQGAEMQTGMLDTAPAQAAPPAPVVGTPEPIAREWEHPANDVWDQPAQQPLRASFIEWHKARCAECATDCCFLPPGEMDDLSICVHWTPKPQPRQGEGALVTEEETGGLLAGHLERSGEGGGA